MLHRLLIALFLCYSLSFGNTDLPHGTIYLKEVIGHVELMDPETGESYAAEKGFTWDGPMVVTTGSDGNIMLSLSNGSSIEIYTDAVVHVFEYYQQPYYGNDHFTDLAADPSVSYTNIYIEKGEIFGHTKPLHKGSIFILQTPTMYNEVWGTIYSVSHEENTNTGNVTVYEGNVFTEAVTDLTSSEINTLTNLDDLNITQTLASKGESVTVQGNSQATTILFTDVDYNEYSNFKDDLVDYSANMGIDSDTLQTALDKAFNATKTGTDNERISLIQTSVIQTDLGPGFQINIIIKDQVGNEQTEQIVGATLTNADGSTRTISTKTTTLITPNSVNVFSQNSDETTNTDGSYTKTDEVTVSSYDRDDFPIDSSDSPIRIGTYTATTDGDVDGNITKAATKTYNNGTSEYVFTENVSISKDESGKPQRTVTRDVTVNNVTDSTLSGTFSTPVVSSSTVTIMNTMDGQIQITGSDGSGSTIQYTEDGKIVTTTNDEGTTSTSILSTSESTPSGVLRQIDGIGPVQTSFSENEDGGFTQVVQETSGTNTITTTRTVVRNDDGTTTVTTTVVNNDSETGGTSTVETVVEETNNGDGTFTQTTTETTTDESGNSTTDTTTDTTSTPISPDNDDLVIDTSEPTETTTTLISVERLENGGSKIITEIDNGDSTITERTVTRTVRDNGLVNTEIVEVTKDADGNTTETKVTTITQTYNSSGTIEQTTTVVTTDANGNTTTDSNTVDLGTDGGTGDPSDSDDPNQDADDGTDDATDDIDDLENSVSNT